MSSFVWGRDPQEAFDNPYEYDAQEQFVREAKVFLKRMTEALDGYNMKFNKADVGLKKATWMLLQDLVDSLYECLVLIQEKRHRVASRLFRDVVETLDLLKLFHSGTEKASRTLEKWYENEVISHGKARDYLKDVEGEAVANARRDYYRQLSRFTHRTYRPLLHSYVLGRGDKLVHDNHSPSKLLVLPQIISAHYAVLGDLIIQVAEIARLGGLIKSSYIEEAWLAALEEKRVPRRFTKKRPNKTDPADA
jgi:hypothetical protein